MFAPPIENSWIHTWNTHKVIDLYSSHWNRQRVPCKICHTLTCQMFLQECLEKNKMLIKHLKVWLKVWSKSNYHLSLGGSWSRIDGYTISWCRILWIFVIKDSVVYPHFQDKRFKFCELHFIKTCKFCAFFSFTELWKFWRLH